jgi:hypothetical protein
MGRCNIDHTHADIVKKFKEQAAFLPNELAGKLEGFLNKDHDQHTLNEVFHLLKKYDLASEDEREARNKGLFAFAD